MSIKNFALIALASTALVGPAYASNAEIDQLMKEINKLKAQVNAIQKKASEPAASAAPVTKPVIACEAHGDGFFVIPGTTSCLRLSGYARADVKAFSGIVGDTAASAYGARIRVNMDYRSSTDAGSLRGYTRFNLNGTQTKAGDFTFGDDAKSSFLEYSYVTLGGWSAGLQDTAFAFFNSPGEVGLISPDDKQREIAASYTLPLGSGLSVTGAVENPYSRITGSGRKDIRPELVGAIRYDQGPVSVKLSAATHNAKLNAVDKNGYAVQAGMKYTVSPETNFTIQGTYADAAMPYLGVGKASGGGTGELKVGVVDDITGNYTSNGWSVLGNLQQKVGNGFVWLTGVYTDVEYNNAYSTQIQQIELSYIWRPYTGLNVQPAVAYVSVDDTTATNDKDQTKGMLRVWREF